MPHVIRFKLQPRAGFVLQKFEHVLNVGKAAGKRFRARGFQKRLFPIKTPVALVFGNHGKAAVVHGAKVAGAKLWLQDAHHIEPFVNRLPRRPASSHIDNSIGFGFDPSRIFAEHLRVRCRAAIVGVAPVDVDDGGSGFDSSDGIGNEMVRFVG